MVEQIWTESVYNTYTLHIRYCIHYTMDIEVEHQQSMLRMEKMANVSTHAYWHVYGAVTLANAAGDDRSSVTLPMQH